MRHHSGSVSSPIDDLTYDVITVLQNKAKALEAYDKYLRDAGKDADLRELFEQMRAHDKEHVRVLKHALAKRLGHGDVASLAGGDEHLDEDDELYDTSDESEVEEPDRGASTTYSDHVEPPPRRGESSHRHG